ncbi:hypothetical protein UFOVP117_342 [uncultured Caudovirales phage]|uniref:Uncharacterized protein n=1 Tax=uncultured Caudovirales phage TaxID=2100421 RepID=A0A6J5L795_9CAUD|nr:hypothetical protein UFOVP117_342 [uncultured Caudovirales phage]
MKKYNPNDKELSDILKMYNEELLGSQTISEKTGISKPTILRILKENGVKLGPSGRRFIGGREVAMKKYESKPQTKERKKENHKTWSEKNREHLNEYHKEWREKNIDKHRKNKRNYEKYRKDTDPIYKLINNFRTAIYQVLKENNVQKNGHYFEILKYSPDELITHLEEQFTGEMSWDNYGIWHVDHIRPISLFNIQEIGDESFMECWSLKNLQPLWGDENIRKSNKM